MAKKKSKKALSAKKNFRLVLKTFLHSTAAFPILLLVLVILLTAFKIHGSSIGMFNEHFYGAGYKDTNLLFGQPRPIRSDEWLSNTPMTISQSYNNFPVENIDVGQGAEGHDMTVVKDFPTKGWETIFKPQNWGFFLLPLENAFSFRWLALSYLLIIATYFFVLEILPGRKRLAILFAAILYFSPFLHWWYLYTSFGSVFYTLFALIFLMRLHKARSPRAKLLWASGLAYVGVAFTFILYPPFQISAAVAGAFFYLGWLLHTFNLRDKKQLKKLGIDFLYIGGALAFAVALIYAYYTQHKEVIQAIMGSEHPGERRILSGDRNWTYFIHESAAHLQYRLQFPRAGITYYTNQSESANFILFAPFMVLPSLYIIFKDWRKKLKPDWILIILNVLLILLLVRQHIPGTDLIFKPLALDRVPNYRLLLGIGLAQFFLIVSYFRRNIGELFKTKGERIFLALVGLAATGFYLWSGFYVQKIWPQFIKNDWEVILASLVMGAIVYGVIRGWRLGLLLLAGFSLFSMFIINPVYRGLGGLPENQLAKEIRRVSSEDDLWAVMEDRRFENLPLSSGRPSITALYSYPRTDLWKPLDPTGAQEEIYNRSAHVVFFYRPEVKESQLTKLAVNHFGVLLNPCSSHPKDIDLDFLLSVNPIDSKCVELVSTVTYPSINFYLYELK